MPYIQKFHRHPATGEPLELKDVVKLNFHKNADGEYHCPVLHKVFTEATHIVALRPTGNVFCYEARRPFLLKVSVVTGSSLGVCASRAAPHRQFVLSDAQPCLERAACVVSVPFYT